MSNVRTFGMCRNPLGTIALMALGALATVNTQASDERRQSIMGRAEQVCPKDLAYLLGHWEASLGGKVYSDVTWEAPEGLCYLVQTWTPRDPANSPFHIVLAYDRKLNNWSYLAGSPWGERLRYENGVSKDGSIELEQVDVSDGAIHRLTYTRTSEDTLRELQVLSKDGGKTWATEYELAWKRKK